MILLYEQLAGFDVKALGWGGEVRLRLREKKAGLGKWEDAPDLCKGTGVYASTYLESSKEQKIWFTPIQACAVAYEGSGRSCSDWEFAVVYGSCSGIKKIEYLGVTTKDHCQ
ncbi:hypothetical protein E6O75_ATG06245 [Venturia nashicola]|uniref:Uncharacterized protein n=1 Tax=Venturia nashicola TaxID=86259 RepID=A0A4Z1NW09_9PEZI|nr:hypothetical protein E6O75_ATG06245 [Venturia nashicola]